ncbi:hypothetical protein HWV62_44782 [Athelia sp. TMB]|nr:hypothetical protein HWV62_44782 [Athelia sp. TMB]
MSTSSDPRDPTLQTKVTFPKTWPKSDVNDALSTSGMFLAGLVMVSKNRYMAWPTLFLAINGLINRHPLRTKENASSPWSTLMLSVTALLVSYSQLFLAPVVAPTAVPLAH